MARVCAEPGCPDLAVDNRHCEKHKRERRANESRAPYRAWALKQYRSKRWQQKRAQQLAEHPYCQCPEHEGLKIPADIADHVEPHRGDPRKFWGGKLMSLTKRCHDSWKQREERNGAQA